MHASASRYHRLARAAALLLLALAPACVFAAAPITLDRDVSDITQWLRSGADANERKVELANPTNKRVHRIVTLDAGSAGLFRFLGAGATSAIVGVAIEGGEATLVDIGGTKAASVDLNPLTTAKITIAAKGELDGVTWHIWKPEVLAAKKQSETLIVGILAGAAAVMAIWLASLALYYSSWQPGWAAVSLAALVVLLLTGSVIAATRRSSR